MTPSGTSSKRRRRRRPEPDTPLSHDARSSDNPQSNSNPLFSAQNSETGSTVVSDEYCPSDRQVVDTERQGPRNPTACTTQTASSQGQSGHQQPHSSRTSTSTNGYTPIPSQSHSSPQMARLSATDLLDVGAWTAPRPRRQGEHSPVPLPAPTPPSLELVSPERDRLASPDLPLLSTRYHFCSCCPGSRRSDRVNDTWHMAERRQLDERRGFYVPVLITVY